MVKRHYAVTEAEAIAAQGGNGAAIAYLRGLIHDRPDDNVPVSQLIQYLIKDQNLDEALKECNSAIFRWPDAVVFFAQKSRILCNQGKAREAVQLLEGFRKSHPDNAQLYRPLAAAYDKAGMPEKAYEAAETLMRLKPDSQEARRLLVETSLEVKHPEAQERHAAYVRDFPSDKKPFRGVGLGSGGNTATMAAIINATEGVQAAIQYLWKVYETGESNKHNTAILIKYLSKAGDTEKAREVYTKMLELQPENREFLKTALKNIETAERCAQDLYALELSNRVAQEKSRESGASAGEDQPVAQPTDANAPINGAAHVKGEQDPASRAVSMPPQEVSQISEMIEKGDNTGALCKAQSYYERIDRADKDKPTKHIKSSYRWAVAALVEALLANQKMSEVLKLGNEYEARTGETLQQLDDWVQNQQPATPSQEIANTTHHGPVNPPPRQLRTAK